MLLERDVPESVLEFYTRAAGYPLQELPAGRITVVGSPQRDPSCRRTVLYACSLHDRTLVTVPLALVGQIDACCQSLAQPFGNCNGDVPERWLEIIRGTYGTRGSFCVYAGVKLYCDAAGFYPIKDRLVCKITPQNAGAIIAALRSVEIPDDANYLLADDAAFAYCIEGKAVAFASTHPVGELASVIGNVMVGTLDAYRRHGYGKAVVATTTAALLAQQRIAVYGTDAANLASINTARAVGYRLACRVVEVRVAG